MKRGVNTRSWYRASPLVRTYGFQEVFFSLPLPLIETLSELVDFVKHFGVERATRAQQPPDIFAGWRRADWQFTDCLAATARIRSMMRKSLARL